MSKYGVYFGQNAVDQTALDYSGWAGILQGCVPDARDLAVMFANLGYETAYHVSGWNIGMVGNVPANQWKLTLQCTTALWKAEHLRLQSIVQPGDTVMFGNSGHGTLYDTPWGFNAGQGMCFADGILRDVQQLELARGWPEGVNVIYLFDTCYSGGMDRAVRPLPRVMPRKPVTQYQRPKELKADGVSARVIEINASRADETSADGPLNGAFTGTFLSVLDTAVLSWASLVEESGKLMQGVFEQHPCINLLGKGNELVGRTP